MLKNIIYLILSVQEKILKHRLSKTLGVKNTSKRKRHYSNGCTLDLNTMADIEKQQLEDEINLILKKYNYEPNEILNYVENQGTKVHFIDNAANLLNPVGENEGFIYPASGSLALYLSLAIQKQPKLKTDEMFVLSKGKINKYYFLYHFYNWFAYKHGIAGLDADSQKLLKKYLYGENDTKELQLADIYKLKDAIKQDKASIEFVIKLCRNYDGAKQALDKMKNDGSANL